MPFVNGVRVCSECGASGDIFRPHLQCKVDGLNSKCHACESARNKKWREANPDHQQKYKEARGSEASRACQRSADLWVKYKLTQQDYAAMLASQGGVCYICGQPEKKKIRGRIVNLAVDHDHKCCSGQRSCGKCVRGLLCCTCNYWVGKVESGDLDKFTAYAQFFDGLQALLRERANA